MAEAPSSINAGHTVADGGDPTMIMVDGKLVPVQHVLILPPEGVLLVDPTGFDQIVRLNGHDVPDDDEASVLEATTLLQ